MKRWAKKILRPIYTLFLILAVVVPPFVVPFNLPRAQELADSISKVKSYNLELRQKLADYNKSPSDSKLNKLKETAKSRKAEVKKVFEQNPADFGSLILDISQFPAEVQGEIEARKIKKGVYRVLHQDFEPPKDTDLLFETKDVLSKRYKLVSDKVRPHPTNIEKDIEVKGYQVDNYLWYAASDNYSLSTAVAVSAQPETSRNLGVFYVNFVDNRTRALTRDDINDYVFHEMKDFLAESSWGKFNLTGQTYELDLDVNKTCELAKFDLSSWDGDLIVYTTNKAQEMGININQFSDKMVIIDPSNTCEPAGGQSLRGPGWAYSVGKRSISHEFGHNLWLAHSGSYDCLRNFIYDDCQRIEYGNYTDIMGSSGGFYLGDFGPYAKEYLGWLSPTQVQEVSTSGTYTIEQYEKPTDSLGPIYPAKVLKIRTTNDGPVYYLVYRHKTGSREGATIELASNEVAKHRMTWLLDTTPDSNIGGGDFTDGYLHDNQVVVDPYNGITFKGIGHDFDKTTVEIGFGQPASQYGGLDVSWNMAPGYFSTVGQKKDINWADVHYIVEMKCYEGPYCTNDWNQWSGPGCDNWPDGCTPIDTTGTSAQLLVGDSSLGYKYKYRVSILTKKDGDPNTIAIYPWINETEGTTNCSGASCIIDISWPKAVYHVYLQKHSDGSALCSGTLGCQDYMYTDATTLMFRGLPTGLRMKAKVELRDLNGSVHLLEKFDDLGTSENYFRECTGTDSFNCTIPPLSFVGSEPFMYSLKIKDRDGMIMNGPALANAFGNGSYTFYWSAWDYYAVLFPSSFDNCYEAGIECQVLSLYDSTDNSFNYSFYGLKYDTNYRLIVCAQTCNPPSGNTVIHDQIYRSDHAPYPTFFQSDPFDYPSVMTGSYTAEYFNNDDFTDKKVTKVEPVINFDWASGSPDVSVAPDTFSARWTGDFDFVAGNYRFNSVADDRIKVYIDGNLIIDGTGQVSKKVFVDYGTHQVKVEYVERFGNASVAFNAVNADFCSDITGENAIDLSDTLLVLGHFGESQPNSAYDLINNDGVDLSDALHSLDLFGTECY